MKLAVLLVTIAALSSLADASCPNACSGHGSCGTNDECTCFRNWIANDCSERVCTYGISHTTTPQGDLNMDGDRYDNTHKAIVYKTGDSAGESINAFVSHLDNKLVFSFADVATNEINVNDQITIQGYDYVIAAVDTDGKTFTLDQDQTHSTTGLSGPVYKKVVNMAAPGGTWESWPGDAVATPHDEGHFYMECSNQGLCDRGAGLCECFDGYAGRACDTTTCPNNCNGRGKCATIAQMAWMKPHASANTVEVVRGSDFVSTGSMVTGLAAGDRVYLGEQTSFDAANLYTVTRVVAVGATTTLQGFYISPRSQVTLSFGSKLYKAATYALWDADKVSGCVCDAGYSGHDCSARNCNIGHDPLDVKGEDKTNTLSSASTTNPSTYTKRNERQMLTMDSTHGAVSGTFKLTYTDPHGAKLTTGDISTTPMLSSTVRVGAPNAIDDVYCKEANKANYALTANGFEGCYKTVYFTPDLPDTELALGDFIRVGQDMREVGALTRSSLSGGYTSATVKNLFSATFGSGTYAHRQSAANAIELALEGLPSGAVGAITAAKSKSSGQPIMTQLKAAAAVAITGSSGAVAFNADPARDSLMPGDVIRIHGFPGQSQITGLVVAGTIGGVDSATTSAKAFYSANDNGNVGNAADIANTAVRDSGFKYRVSFDKNSGDVADLVCATESLRPVYRMGVSGYVTRDEPDRIYFVDTHQGSSQPVYQAVSNVDKFHPEAVSAGDVLFIGEQRCDVVSADNVVESNQAPTNGGVIQPFGATGYSSASVVCANALAANAHSTANELFTHETLEVKLGDETVTCSATDSPSLRFMTNAIDALGGAGLQNDACIDLTSCADVFSYNGENRLVTFAMANGQPTAAINVLMDNSDLVVGDRVSFRTATHTYEVRTVDSITTAAANSYFTVSQPFSAAHAEKEIRLQWKGSTGGAVCSGRGICDDGTGDCQCFKGYTGQSCQIQNALAA